MLILREVLAFSAAEVATQLDTTVASVNSALQRARKSLDQRIPEESQQSALRALGVDGRRELVDAFVAGWERADVPAILGMLVEDARLTMPPLPGWFHGLDDIACYQGIPTARASGSVRLRVLTLRGGRIVEMTGFLDPEIHVRFGLPGELPG